MDPLGRFLFRIVLGRLRAGGKLSPSGACHPERPRAASARQRRISGDIVQDQKNGATYYLIHIATPSEEIARLDGLKLLPGMPVDAFIQTEARTVLSYLIKPLRDQIVKAFRSGTCRRAVAMRRYGPAM